MIRTTILSSLAVATALLGSARAGVLFERTVVIDRSANIFTSLDFDLDLVVADDFLAPTQTHRLFDGLSITPTDAGATYIADFSDSAFVDVIAKLTDSQDEIIKIVFSEASTGRTEERGFNERNFFFASNPILPPDLAGSSIGSISVKVDGFTLDFGSNTGGATASPPVELALTIAFNGAVPEPQTWALAGSGLAIFAALGWLTRRRTAGASVPVRSRGNA